MTLSTLLLALAPFLGPPVEGPEVAWTAPPVYVRGQPFKAHVEIVAPDGGTVIASWLLTPAAFSVNGKAIAKRATDEGALQLPPSFHVSGDIDLGPFLEADADFKLGYATEVTGTESLSVILTEPAAAGVNFAEMPADELASYLVVMETSRGMMTAEFFPDVAPNHVRNFLDLAATGFYEGTLFHRVKPGFMIQGGDPNTRRDNKASWGSGSGPRALKAEFSDKLHERGILSMARGDDPNSASCQFFVMHGRAPFLDKKYSVFGKLISGFDTLDVIAKSPGEASPDTTIRPKDPAKIEKMIVCRRVKGASK